jgi:hypothetical protein
MGCSLKKKPRKRKLLWMQKIEKKQHIFRPSVTRRKNLPIFLSLCNQSAGGLQHAQNVCMGTSKGWGETEAWSLPPSRLVNGSGEDTM